MAERDRNRRPAGRNFRRRRAGRSAARIRPGLNKLLPSIFLNIIIFSFAVLAYSWLVKLMISMQGYILPLQKAVAASVYYIQKPFFDVFLHGTGLFYPDFSIDVTFDCVGIRQMVFFLLLMLSFYQADLRSKAWGLIFLPVIFAANILRIFILYPFFLLFGLEKTAAFHEFIYSYGNGIFILLLLVIWFYVFVYRMQKASRVK